jgi:hypothetical protein
MLTEILLIANFLLFVALVLEAKVRSKLGYFIVLTGLIIGIVDLIFALLLLVK